MTLYLASPLFPVHPLGMQEYGSNGTACWWWPQPLATPLPTPCPLLPTGYPEQYLARCKLPKAPISSIITQNLSTLPSGPLQNASAAQQVYIALYFLPEALHGDNALMKTVVAQHFSHSWVVPWAPGHLADVSLHWQSYRAARNALGAALPPATTKRLAASYGSTALAVQSRRTQKLQDNITKVRRQKCRLRFALYVCACCSFQAHVCHAIHDGWHPSPVSSTLAMHPVNLAG